MIRARMLALVRADNPRPNPLLRADWADDPIRRQHTDLPSRTVCPCGARLTNRRRDARYCSAACRQKAWRERTDA